MKFEIIFNDILLNFLRFAYRLWMMNNSVECNPRSWANDELKKFSPLFSGDVVNVSAGKDGDKRGMKYRDYFSKASSYTITNYFLEFERNPEYNEIQLDLSGPIRDNILSKEKFDVVLNFTVLEHIYNVHQAVENLCKLSGDIVITVVPFVQELHQIPNQYKDYWRISPYSLAYLFESCGFHTVYISWNRDPLGNIYVFHISSCQPENWTNEILPARHQYGPGAERLHFKTDTLCNYDRTEVDYDLIYKNKHRYYQG